MLKRKLVFYRWTSLDPAKPFDPHSTMGRLADEMKQIREFEILDSGDYKSAVLPTFFSDRSKAVRIQMLSLRGGTKLPVKWRPDSPLKSIPLLDGEYSADVTHICIWSDGIAAQEYHSNAPRMGRFSEFLRKKLDTKIFVDGLYNPNMFAKLDDLHGQVRSVQLALLKPETWNQNRRPGALQTLIPAFAGRKTPTLRLTFGMGRYGPRDRYLDADVEEAVFEIAERAHEQVDTMIIRGTSRRTGRSEQVDLLNERVHEEVELRADDDVPSVPVADDTFKAIEKARISMDSVNLLRDAIQAQAAKG